jgi:hypothetical protein
MAESTSLVAVHRELLVVQHQLPEQLDLLDLIVRRRSQPLDCLCLDAVNLGLDLRGFLQRLRREPCAGLLRTRRIYAQRGGDQGRRNRKKRML